MTEKTWIGIWCVGAALVLGALADMLLRGVPLGINAFLWTAALVGLAVAMFALRGVSWRGRWMLFVALLFASLLAWRDSTFLAFLNVCAVLGCLSFAAWGSAGGLAFRGVSGYALSSLYSGAFVAAGPLPTVISDIDWTTITGTGNSGTGVSENRWRKPVLSALLGVCLAAPLLLVFGALLVSADAVFADIIGRIFSFDLSGVLDHAFLVILFAWLSAGYLRTAFSRRESPDPSVERPVFLSLGPVEVNVVLGLLNALFLAFIVVQARYLFGGAQRVAAGLTYAEYARSGFFELVAVVALVLPVLLAAHWLLASQRIGKRIFIRLAAMTVALVLVIMTSALWRMSLYYNEFGLTELRLYSTAFMLWLGVVLVVFVLTVLRDLRGRFAAWTISTGLAAALLLNVVNPDALIARANIERLEEGKRFDPSYLALLSDDAAPVISTRLPEAAGEREISEDFTLEDALLEEWRDDPDDWRAWNLSRARADDISRELSGARSPI